MPKCEFCGEVYEVVSFDERSGTQPVVAPPFSFWQRVRVVRGKWAEEWKGHVLEVCGMVMSEDGTVSVHLKDQHGTVWTGWEAEDLGPAGAEQLRLL